MLIVGVVALAVFLILWIVKAILKDSYSKKKYLILTSSSFALVVLSIILGVSTSEPIDRDSVNSLRDRGSEITGLKTSSQIAEEKALLEEEEEEEAREKAKVEELAKKEAAEVIELENEQREKELAEQKEQEQLAKKVTAEKAEKEKAELEMMAKEQAAKVAAEQEKKNTVLIKSKEIIYNVFKNGEDKIDEIVTSIEFNEDEKVLMATVKGKDGWSEKSIGLGFYEDSTAVYRELAKDKRIAEAWITIAFPMKDVYGNIEDEEVMVTWLSRETMDKINWKSFSYQNLLDVADGKRIYPQFLQ